MPQLVVTIQRPGGTLGNATWPVASVVAEARGCESPLFHCSGGRPTSGATVILTSGMGSPWPVTYTSRVEGGPSAGGGGGAGGAILASGPVEPPAGAWARASRTVAVATSRHRNGAARREAIIGLS